MSRLQLLRELYRHMEWADASAWRAVLSHPAAASDRRILELLYHLHVAQWSFLRLWRGEPREAPYPEFTELSPMTEWGRSWHREAAAWLAGVSEESLVPPMPVPWAAMVERRLGRPSGETTLGDTILQVALHTHHHRAQVNARVKELGGTPPLVDYIAWIWYGKPNAEWP